ncbi:hypothetical protein D3C75_813080 [compost metagenome]
MAGFVIGVLDQGNAEHYGQLAKHNIGHGRHILGHILEAQLMAGLGALLFAQTDGDHLHDPAFDPAAEGGMGLHPVDDYDGISLIGVFVHIDRQPVRQLSQLHYLHRGTHGNTHGFLIDAQMVQHFLLAFRCSAAVAAHTGDDERMGACVFDGIHRGPGNGRNVGDAAAAHRYGNLLARLDGVQGAGLFQLLLECGNGIGKLGIVKTLADAHNPRNRNIAQ